MINLYSAIPVEINWFLCVFLLLSSVSIMIPGLVNVLLHKRRFLYGDRYGAIFVFGLPVLCFTFFQFNGGWLNNDVLVQPKSQYEGLLNIYESTGGSENIKLGTDIIQRSKFRYHYLSSHCWVGAFSDVAKLYPEHVFKLQIVWVASGEYYTSKDKPKDAFPCILKVDVLTDAS